MSRAEPLSESQYQTLAAAQFSFKRITAEQFSDILAGRIDQGILSDAQIVELLEAFNILYRSGEPLISDQEYDFVYLEELRRRRPEHPFLHQVEPEALVGVKTVALPARMLSTEKAYSFEDIEKWWKRVEKAAEECGIDFSSLLLRATPKLDGYAAFDDGTQLYTRGDGRRGTDITRAFERGLQVAGGGQRGLGPGEIVVSRSYFIEVLAEHFDNSRNFQASLIKEKELEPPAAEAIRRQKAVFFPFALLPDWQGPWQDLADGFEEITGRLWEIVDYDIDGIVIEILDLELREFMGATRHHHRWQIAYKKNTETAEVTVLQVIPQTSRSGRVNPVAELEPVRLSGALIRRASVHHYNMVKQMGVGAGARIRLSRSGEVIPKIEEVLEPVAPDIPSVCPSCGTELVWENDYLLCVNNMQCPAQITHAIEHFFKTLGNIDGFGPSSINKIYEGGYQRIIDIYRLGEQDFISLGFGAKQSRNMVEQLLRSRLEPIEDWRFLAAFGVYRMGMGNCEKLLGYCKLEQIFELGEQDFISIKGFGEKSAHAIFSGIQAIREIFSSLYNLEFNLLVTPLAGDIQNAKSPLAEKVVVFTGTMQQGSREDMKKQARALGAKIGTSVTGKTDLLVCGTKVGAAKLKKAESLGLQILSEKDYLQLLES
jgi:DNA ligase (NAD+)